jgi:hypothetical protein
MSEKRRVYRSTEDLDSFKVAVAWSEQDYVDAELVDLSSKGAAISLSLPDGEPPTFPVGTPVRLRIEAPGVEPVNDIIALVRNERDDDGKRVFGLEIVEWRTLAEKLPARYFASFNRRRHFRMNVPDKPPINVAVVASENNAVITATLVNISIGGCLLACPVDEGPQTGDRIRIKFSLPALPHELSFAGAVMSRNVAGEISRCGIEFEDTTSKDFQAQEELILRYIMERQRESLATRIPAGR